MINIFLSAGKVFVWNAEDVIKLRKEYRIVGSLAGIYPSRPFQIQAKWLPLQLMLEEARLLIDKGFAKLISSPEKLTEQNLIKEFNERRSKLCEQQIILLKENRKKIIMEKADEIYEGKKRKFLENQIGQSKKPNATEPEGCFEESKSGSTLNSDAETSANSEQTTECGKNHSADNEPTQSAITDSSDDAPSDIRGFMTDKETVIQMELDKVSEVSKDLCIVQLFTEAPWKNVSAIAQLNFPVSEIEKLRSAVFRNLWEKQFYVTSGLKFGGDFLAYKGDPLKYHACFVVVCVPRSVKMQAIDVLAYGRLGHQVKKTVALAQTNSDGEVEYISVTWDSDL